MEPGTACSWRKLIEYMAFDPPHPGVMPPARAAGWVDGLAGAASPTSSRGASADALERLLDDPPLRVDRSRGPYDRVNLARELATVLDQVAASERAEGLSAPKR